MHIAYLFGPISMRKGAIGGIAVIAVIASVAGYFLASPRFIVTEVNEPIPTAVATQEYQNLAL